MLNTGRHAHSHSSTRIHSPLGHAHTALAHSCRIAHSRADGDGHAGHGQLPQVPH